MWRVLERYIILLLNTTDKLRQDVDSLNQFDYEIVDDSENDNGKPNFDPSQETMLKIYLVKVENPDEDNYFNEYITVRTQENDELQYKWELLGTTKIDISGKLDTSTYNADKSDIETSISNEATARENADTALSNRITTNTNNISTLQGYISTLQGDTSSLLTSLSNYYTKSETYSKSEVYTLSETDALFEQIQEFSDNELYDPNASGSSLHEGGAES